MKMKFIPFYKLMPNLVTLAGLCMGISALRFALDEKFIIAASLIVTATILDSLDGRIARLLKCESEFGAQLDSLADIVSFGVAPAIIAYLWSLHQIPYLGVGWSIVLFYISCGALRLARFNSDPHDPEAMAKSKLFFQGIPITASAYLSLLPMISTFEMLDIHYSPWFIAAYHIFLGLFMISSIPTYAGKKIVIYEKHILLVQIASALFIIAVVLVPWWTLPMLGLLYFLLIPCSIIQYRQLYPVLKRKQQ